MLARGEHARGLLAAAILVAATVLAARPAATATEDPKSLVSDAQARIAAGDLRGAEIQLRNAVRANPNDPDLHIQLAELYIKLKAYPAAEAEAHVAQQDHGDDARVAPPLAQAMMAQGKLQQLLQQIKPGDRQPDSAESLVRLALGVAHFAFGEDDQAEPLLRDAERLDDAALDPKLALTRLLAHKGNVPAAEAELARAKAISPDSADVILLDGELLSIKGDQDGALAKFAAIIEKNPGDVAAHVYRANIYMRRNDLDQAQKDLDAAIKLKPRDLSAVYLDALLLAKKGQLRKAEDVLSNISANFGRLPVGYYLTGAVQYALGEYQQADQNLAKFIARYPTEPTARRLSARIALRRRDYARAIALLEPVIAANADDVESANVLAQAYLMSSKRNQALELYERLAQHRPQDNAVQTQAAVAEIELGNAGKGLGELQKIAGSADGADVAGPVLITRDLRQGLIAEAAEGADKMIKLNPRDVVAENLLGLVRMAQERYADAAGIFAELTKRDSNLLQVQRNLAMAYTALKRPDDAKKTWQAVLQKAPRDIKSLYALAQFATDAKDFDGAAKLLTQAQQAAPKDSTPGILLVRLYSFAKDWDKAKIAGRNLEGQFPGNPAVVDVVASMLAVSGDRAGAAKEFRRVIEAYPKSDTLLARYATYQVSAGDKDGARQSIEKALVLAPSNAEYLRVLVELSTVTKGPEAALETARSFADRQPVESAVLSAGLLMRAQKPDEAIAELTRAQQQNPSGGLAVALAEAMVTQGKPQPAIALLEDWLKAHPESPEAALVRLPLANFDLLAHEDDKAQALYEAVYETAPVNALMLNNLAYLYSKKHDPRAVGMAEQAYYLAPSPTSADTYGWTLLGNGDAADGLHFLQRAAASASKDLTIQYHLAVALNATGDKAKALEVLDAALKSDVNFDGHEDAQKLLAELQHG